MVPEPGEYVGPYEILGQLGSGGMGIVFRAWDERLHREVALKLLHNEYETPNLRERFLIEARAASGLNHPNICTIFDLGDDAGEPFLVMELLSGQTLKDKIAHGAIATEEIVRISIEVADALAWAHSKGVIHRDVKPANVFLLSRPGGQSQAKVLDFGLAKVTAGSRSGRASRALELTSAGSTVGTLAYMSPEQARGESLDARSDLFSLGVVMYEMCTRRVPFRGATSAMVFTALLSQDPESVRNWNDAIPRDLERVIYRLLAKNRTERFQSAHELHEALRRLTLKGQGDWLRKLPRPSIPLVPSADPVARARRGWRDTPEDSPVAEPVQPPSRDHESDPEVHLLRPRRLPRRESGPRESAFGSTSATRAEPDDPSHLPEHGGRLRLVPESSGAMPVAIVPAPVPVKEPVSRPIKSSPALAAPPPAAAVTVSAPQPQPEAEKTLVLPAEEPEARQTLAVEETAVPSVAASSDAIAEPVGSQTESAGRPGRKLWFTAAIAALLILAAVAVYTLQRGSLNQVVLRPGDAVLLTPIQNKTGESELDHAVTQGFEIVLAENSSLHFDGLPAFRAGVRQIAGETHTSERAISAQSVAQRIGARAYLFGELLRSGSGYRLNLNVVDAASNDRMASLSAEAPSRDGLASAITDLSVVLRRRLGEGKGVDVRRPTPLAQQGTGNMAALASFADANLALEDGHVTEAVAGFRRAATLAPGFVLTNIRLAWLCESQGAEVEAAEAAQDAQAASRRAGDRVAAMAQYTRQALADRDLSAATQTARAMTVARPQDVESLMALTRVMRLGGHMTEALLSAEQTVRRGPFNLAGYAEQARALVGLGRYDEALRVRSDADKAGLSCNCSSGAAYYLAAGSKSGGAPEPALAAPEDLGAASEQALALDNGGRFQQGLQVWKTAAAAAQSREGLGSAAGGALAQAALDRALVGRCEDALTLAGESANLLHGQVATLRAGVARALCGGSAASETEAIERSANLHAQATELYLPMLRAADALGARDFLRALSDLSGVREQRDTAPLALYLRGTAHLVGGQDELAVDDLDGIVSHRGRAFLSGSAVYAPALASLTRAHGRLHADAAAARSRAELERLYARADTGILHGSGDSPTASKMRRR